MLLRETIAAAQTRLAEAGVDNPALDARLLAAHALGLDRAALLTQENRALTEKESAVLEANIARREKREPVGRILGLREFWGLPFSLNEATLEPRPDSETLIEAALALFSCCHTRESGYPVSIETNRTPACAGVTEGTFPARILDLGTGTGCLLLALLHEWPTATGLGIDLAPRAVEQAQENAARLGLETRAHFQTGNWLEGINEKFDLIISNPPYIPAQDIKNLSPEVRDFDPRLALDGGTDGLDPYRRLIPQFPSFLMPQGAALFEVGIGQAEPVAALLRQAGFKDVSVRRDLGGIERCVSGFSKNEK